MFCLAAPVDISSTTTADSPLKDLDLVSVWRAFVLEADERKMQPIFNTGIVCRLHSDEIIYR